MIQKMYYVSGSLPNPQVYIKLYRLAVMVFCLYIAIFCSPFTSVVFVQLILYEREHIQTNTILRVCIVKIIHGKVS